ncbi:MAG: DHA2 family efflux MFS transporter permease subunit [Acidobacteriaceae bacterium]|nr:DHA2 family efflux MFS transporter permease subunit [Acidobacteriaceae bacterium]MBV9502185.1 DHA2 family efflux MFS transporter permease subunit [Acidobacteriaceae bacterium]
METSSVSEAAPSKPPASSGQEAVWTPKFNPWLIALTVTLASFMEVLDTSIANVALPHIAGGLSASEDEATWVLTSYLVSNAIILPLSGWFSLLLGRKYFYMTCVALFTLSSFLCGIAPTLGLLVLFRVLQGVGGGGLQPSEQAILADTFPPKQRGMAFAIYGVAVVTAPAIGPTLGGWITDNWDWRWIFFINIPVGAVSLFLTSFMLEDPPYLVQERLQRLKTKLRVDYWGIIFVALGLGFLQIVLDKGERDDWWASGFIRTCMLISAAGLILAIYWEFKQEEPVVDLSLLKNRNFGISAFLMFMVGVVLLGSTVLIPQYLQLVMGYSATQAGLAISPGGLLVMCLLPFVGFLLGKVESRWMIGVGLAITSLALIHMANFDIQMDFKYAVLARCFQAAGLAFLFVPINTAAYAFVPPTKNNAASGLINLARNVGGSLGISIVTTLLDRRAQFHQARLVEHTTALNPAFNQALNSAGRLVGSSGHESYALILRRLQQQATTLSYIDCFWSMGIVFGLLIPLIFLMRKAKPGRPAMAH